MRETRLLMGMPITLHVLDLDVSGALLERVFAFFAAVDERFSPFKATSEVARINRGELSERDYSADLRMILDLAEQTRVASGGYFDIWHAGACDPSGIVKGWSIREAARLLSQAGMRDFLVDAGGDLQVCGTNHGAPWRVGIRNPFNRAQHVKVLALSDCGVATSGTAMRGQHIHDPHHPRSPLLDVVSVTVVGPDVYEADRFATAAFAMGREGIRFLRDQAGLEAYMIDAAARATFTSGFERYVAHP